MEQAEKDTTKEQEPKENVQNVEKILTKEEIKADEDRKEQERTTLKKAEFLEVMERAMGVIGLAAEAVGVHRRTITRWTESDSEFRAEMGRIKKEQLSEVEDKLLKAIIKDESWAIALYLKSNHPTYRPKQEIYIPTEKTLEDLLDEAESKNEQGEQEKNDTDRQQNTNRETLEDKEQEGPAGAVQTEPSADILLGEKNEEKLDSESPAKGDQ